MNRDRLSSVRLACAGRESIICPLREIMPPIRISPEVPIYISADQSALSQAKQTTQSRVVGEILFVLPVGKNVDYLVHVDGFPDDPGGIVKTSESLQIGAEIRIDCRL